MLRKEKLKVLLMISTFIILVQCLWAQDTIYFATDFETSDGGMQGKDCWEWGPVLYGPDWAHSGFLCWGTDMDTVYPGNMQAFLETPEIDLSMASTAKITLWHWYEFEADQGVLLDGGNISISADGAPFEILVPFQGYCGLLENWANPLDGQPVFSGLDQMQWQMISVNLNKFVGQIIVLRFTIGSDEWTNYAGWYIDDIYVTSNSQKDAALWSIGAPGALVDLNSSPVKPTAVVYNAGGLPLDFSVRLDVLEENQNIYHSTREILQLAADKRDTVLFEPWYINQTGEFILIYSVSANEDRNIMNDSLKLIVTIIDAPFSEITAVGLTEYMHQWGKIQWGDYDNDHWPDAFISGDTLMRNQQNGYFEPDLVLPSTFENNPLAGFASSWGDINNDGNLDLFVGHYLMGDSTIPGKFLLKKGNQFEDITSQSVLKKILNIQDVSWFDYDGDGDLDLYIGAYDFPNQLYNNSGNGEFFEVGLEAGVALRECRYFCPFDFDGDQDIDLLLYGRWPLRVILLSNDGNGKFSDQTASCGFDTTGNYKVNNVAVADFNNDGWLDIFIAAGYQSGFYINQGNGSFSEKYSPSTLPVDLWDAESCDFNNDGYIDLLFSVSTLISQSGLAIYENHGNLEFIYRIITLFQSDKTSFSHILDYDNDGDQDIIASDKLILRNNLSGNNWIKVDLQGSDCNRFGIGAKLKIKHNGFLQFREISTGGSMSNPKLTCGCFGLGSDTRVDTLTVVWPCGHVDQVINISANQWITVAEDVGITSTHTNEELPETLVLNQNFPNPFNAGTYILYDLPSSSIIELTIYNILGQKIRTLVDNMIIAGHHRIYWDGKDGSHHTVASGIYIYELRTGSITLRKKMLLIK